MNLLRRALLIAALALLAPLETASAQEPVPPPDEADHSIGRIDAPVTIIEYASFTCSHCANWHQFVYPLLKTRYIDTGQVRLVFRNLPTGPTGLSRPAAELARCARTDRFFDVAGALFAGQAAVLRDNDVAAWHESAIAVSGRPYMEMRACAAEMALLNEIDPDIEGAVAAGVQGTPAFFVNGARVTDGSLGGLEIAIRAAQAER